MSALKGRHDRAPTDEPPIRVLLLSHQRVLCAGLCKVLEGAARALFVDERDAGLTTHETVRRFGPRSSSSSWTPLTGGGSRRSPQRCTRAARPGGSGCRETGRPSPPNGAERRAS
jgi:hypothetical protein